jgi:hypothetical protein
MVYMSGDNEREKFIAQDIAEMAIAGSSAHANVMVLEDRVPGYASNGKKSGGDWTSTKLFKVYRGMVPSPATGLEDWGERDFGDAQTLIDFVTRAKELAPADRYLLVFWGKGYTWHPGHSLLDATTHNTLDLDEIKASLPSLGAVDVVAYDAGHMGSVEVAGLWHGKAGAVAFSEGAIVGASGINYQEVLVKLNVNPLMSENELAVEISKSATDSSTFSAVTLDARFDTLLHRVNKWASALVRGLSDRPVQIHEVYDVNTNHANFGQAFRSTKHFASYETEKDLYDLASNVWDLGIKERYGIEDEKLKATSKAVLDAVTGVVLHERHSDAEKGAHGLTIYHISCELSKETADHRFYRNLDFSMATNWVNFIDMYATATGCTS